MDILLIVISVITIIALIVVLLVKSRRTANSNGKDIFVNDNLIPTISESHGIIIPIERLPATTVIDERRLFELIDHTVIARISETFPTAASTAAKTITNNALKNVITTVIFNVQILMRRD